MTVDDRGEGGVCQIMTVDDQGEGGGQAYLVRPDDVISGQPLILWSVGQSGVSYGRPLYYILRVHLQETKIPT